MRIHTREFGHEGKQLARVELYMNLLEKSGEPTNIHVSSHGLDFQTSILSVRTHTLFGQNPHPFRSKPTGETTEEYGLVEPY
jgi:hypothetical protein